jgi:hypothetical protein
MNTVVIPEYETRMIMSDLNLFGIFSIRFIVWEWSKVKNPDLCDVTSWTFECRAASIDSVSSFAYEVVLEVRVTTVLESKPGGEQTLQLGKLPKLLNLLKSHIRSFSLEHSMRILMCVAPCIFVYDYNYLHQQMHYYFFIKHTPRLHVST